MISKLDVRLRTLTPSPTLPSPWEPKTPHNVLDTQSQSTYCKDRIVRHQNGPPNSLLQRIDQVAKGAANAIYELLLLREENAALRKANDLLTRRHRRKRRRLQERGVLTVEAIRDLEAQREAIYNYKPICEKVGVVQSKPNHKNNVVDVADKLVIPYELCSNVIDTSNDSSFEELRYFMILYACVGHSLVNCSPYIGFVSLSCFLFWRIVKTLRYSDDNSNCCTNCLDGQMVLGLKALHYDLRQGTAKGTRYLRANF